MGDFLQAVRMRKPFETNEQHFSYSENPSIFYSWTRFIDMSDH